MIRIIIADDQAVLRESLKYIIEKDPQIQVVGCAGDGYQAFRLCKEQSPDLVLMDIVMPECDGLESTRLIKKEFPAIKIIILTTFKDEENIKKALKQGASGYILKDIDPADLIFAIRSTVNDLRVVHEEVFDFVVNNVNSDTGQETVGFSEGKGLKENELKIIELIVKGKSNKEIAGLIYLSEGRVKNIITDILRKLNVNDRTELAVTAVKNNLV